MPSSVVASFRYDKQHATLKVVFVSGDVYEYFNVPESIYEAMRASGSKGTFLNKEIKPNYSFRKVN